MSGKFICGGMAGMPRSYMFLATILVGTVLILAGLAHEDTTANESDLPRATYGGTLSVIKQQKEALLQQYLAAETAPARDVVLRQAGELFVQAVVTEVTPYWYGTPWDFNGMTQVPGAGSIACGYFVTTVLRDMGVDLARVRLAQQPSEILIKSLVGSAAIKRFSDVKVEKFLAAVRNWGQGLYIVGLDMHVGFIVSDDTGIHFVHASYMAPLCVVQEDAAESVILAGSRYRVLGKLTGDNDFLLAWLQGEAISPVER